MKFAFEIKTKPVTRAAIIIAVVMFSSVLLALITIYLSFALAGIICTIILVVIVYLALRLAPC
jgi:hypothetical protein